MIAKQSAGARGLTLAAVLLAGAARAATLSVPGQYATISAAISHAQPADIITVAAGTYHENLTLPVSVAIHGAGAAQTIVDGGQTDSVVTVNPGYSVTLSDMKLTNGLGTGGLGAGGGVFNEGSLRIERCIIAGNNALNSGAGICNYNGDMTLVDCAVSGNLAADAGGGIVNTANLTMQNCLVSGNVTGASPSAVHGIGGGIANSGALDATNCTVYGNAAEQGAGIYNAAGSVTLESCTIYRNAAQQQGGGLSGLAATLSHNSIVAGNTSAAGSGPDVDGAITSYGHNFIGTTRDSAITVVAGYSGDITGSKSSSLDPKLQTALTNNGGPTLTCLPLTGSSVIDKGDPASYPSRDARGIIRPQDGDLKGDAAPDIGAVELQANYVVINTNDVAPGQVGYSGSLRAAIDNVNAGPGDAIVSFAIPGPGVRTIRTAGYLITRTVFVDGWSQGGANYKGTPLIELDGSGHPSTFGLNIQADGVVARGLCINSFPAAGAGNAFGIGVFAGSGAWIYGCSLGTDPTGMLPRPNGQGGVWLGSGGTILGTNGDGVDDDAERNIISANGAFGALISSSGNTVAGNIIGGNRNAANPNGDMGNLNIGVGVSSGAGNAILGNSIAFNGLDIDLGVDGPTPNRSPQPATGPNASQNYPAITGVASDGSTISFTATLNSLPSQTFRLEFFASDASNTTGYGGGQRYLGSAALTTNASGDGAVTAGFSLAAGIYLTATATDAAGDTSEFCQAVHVVGKPTISGSAATNVSTTSATLNVVVGTGGLPTTVQFQLKNGGAYTDIGPATIVPAGASGPRSLPAPNLPPGAALAFRVRATNALDSVTGPDIPFTTLAPSSGDALLLDGSSGMATIPDNGYNSYPLTVSAWIKTGAAQGYAGIVSKYTNDSFNGWVVGVFGTSVHAWYMRNASNAVFNAASLGLNGGPVADNQWHNVAFVVDAAGGRLYVDGALKDSLPWTGTAGPCTAPDPVRVGLYSGLGSAGGPYFAGQVDEVRLWSTALSGAQVQAAMARRLAGSEPGLLADFRLDEGTGTGAADAVAGVAATLSGGASWIPSGAFDDRAPGSGSSLAFNGSTSDVNVPGFGAAAPTTEATIEFWQFVGQAKQQAAFSIGDYASANRISCHTPWADGAVYWDFGNLSTDGRLAYTPPASILGSWQHYAFVASQSGAYMRIYRNGILEAAKTKMTPFIPDASALRIGAGGADYTGGTMEEFRVWNVARTQAQIQASMNRTLTGAEPGLIAYYPMDEGAGPAINDATGHGHTGYLEAGPIWTPSGVPLSAPFTAADAARALRLAGGLLTATTADARLNLNATPGVDLSDAVSIARRAAGLDP
ncbi:MAG TPA: LamG-like jellyroll fold domain-containing protein [Armatimonadota bacterium]